MQVIVQIALNLLAQLVPQLAGVGAVAAAPMIAKIIEALEVLVPLIIKEYKAMIPALKRIIAAIKNSGKLSEDEWNTLTTYEVEIDNNFDEAARKALEEDETADNK